MFAKWYILYDLDLLDELIKEKETYIIQRNQYIMRFLNYFDAVCRFFFGAICVSIARPYRHGMHLTKLIIVATYRDCACEIL